MKAEIAAITFCYDSVDMWESLELIKKAGYEYVELWYDHKGDYINFKSNNCWAPDLVRNRIDEIGLKVSSICIGLIEEADLELLPRAFEFTKILGTNKVNGYFEDFDILSSIDLLCQNYKIQFGVENHWKSNIESIADLKILMERSSDNFGINIDIAQLVASGQDPLHALEVLKDYIHHVQFQDIADVGVLKSVLPGTGKANLKGVLDFLNTTDFNGVISVEHDEDRNVDLGLTTAIKMIQKELS